MPGYTYIVLGSGKQGLAAAYDLIRHGAASRLTLADSVPAAAQSAVRTLKKLLSPFLKNNQTHLSAWMVGCVPLTYPTGRRTWPGDRLHRH